MVATSSAAVALPVERDLQSNGFPKELRLRKPAEFRNVFQNGKKIVTHTLVFHALKTNLEDSRLGLAVSRKVGKAVRRNKVKRRIREVFRCVHRTLPGSYDLVVYPRRGVLEKTIEDYRHSFHILSKVLEKRGRQTPKNPPRQ